MSIQSEITRIQNAKQAIKEAINIKGGGLTNELLSQYSTALNNLIKLGVVDENGKFQEFDFTGTTPSDSGDALTVQNYKSWNSTLPAPGPAPSPLESMNFYKCVSVDTMNHTWTGYKAILNRSGYYEFELTITTGLEYTSVTPVVDGVYSADALIKATLYTGYPVDGMALYIPLKSAQSTAETGQSLSTTGTITYTTENSIPCAQLSYASNIAISGSIQVGTSDFAISLWEKNTYWSDSSILWASSGNTARLVVLTNGTIQTTSGSGDTGRINYSGADSNAWHHILFQRNNGTDYLYVDGISVGTTSDTANLTFSQMYLGRWRSDDNMTGYISALRIYNRSLSSEEIALLASEFTPTNS